MSDLANPPTPEFLSWLVDRLVYVHKESPNVDFVQRLQHEAARAQTLYTNVQANQRTYRLVSICGDTHDTHETERICSYLLQAHSSAVQIDTELRLTSQQAADLSRQLDAPIDYYID